MSRSLHFAIASAVALAFAAPAIAQTQVEERVVTYGDLNVNSATGADALIRRINNASEQVCGVNDGRTNTRQAIINRNCESDATANGVSDTGNRVVIARYHGTGYAVIDEGDTYYDAQIDPASPSYDARLDPNSPYYIPPVK
jgi:UrcA family protein